MELRKKESYSHTHSGTGTDKERENGLYASSAHTFVVQTENFERNASENNRECGGGRGRANNNKNNAENVTYVVLWTNNIAIDFAGWPIRPNGKKIWKMFVCVWFFFLSIFRRRTIALLWMWAAANVWQSVTHAPIRHYLWFAVSGERSNGLRTNSKIDKLIIENNISIDSSGSSAAPFMWPIVLNGTKGHRIDDSDPTAVNVLYLN